MRYGEVSQHDSRFVVVAYSVPFRIFSEGGAHVITVFNPWHFEPCDTLDFRPQRLDILRSSLDFLPSPGYMAQRRAQIKHSPVHIALPSSCPRAWPTGWMLEAEPYFPEVSTA